MSTLKRRLVSIGVIHKFKGHYFDNKHQRLYLKDIENLYLSDEKNINIKKINIK